MFENDDIRLYDDNINKFNVLFSLETIIKTSISSIICAGLLYSLTLNLTNFGIILAISLFVMVASSRYNNLMKYYVRNTQRYGYLINNISLNYIKENTIDSYNFDENKDEYKSIEVDYEISNQSVTIKNKDLNCTWVFKRDEIGLLSTEGQKVVDSLQEENGICALTIKYTGEDYSNLKSECGNYWISEESL